MVFLLPGVAVLAGTSSMVAMRHGSSIVESAWKGVLGRRGYEITLQNLGGTTKEEHQAAIRRILRWIGYLPEVRNDCRKLMRFNLQEADQSITTLRLPLEAVTFDYEGRTLWVEMQRNQAGLIHGFVFWTKRWGVFSSGSAKTNQEAMMAMIDRIIDGKERVKPLLQISWAERLSSKVYGKLLDPAVLDRALRLVGEPKASIDLRADVSNDLAGLYEKGAGGLPQDKDKAIELYRKGWKGGCLAASWNLGRIAFERRDLASFKIFVEPVIDAVFPAGKGSEGLESDLNRYLEKVKASFHFTHEDVTTVQGLVDRMKLRKRMVVTVRPSPSLGPSPSSSPSPLSNRGLKGLVGPCRVSQLDTKGGTGLCRVNCQDQFI